MNLAHSLVHSIWLQPATGPEGPGTQHLATSPGEMVPDQLMSNIVDRISRSGTSLQKIMSFYDVYADIWNRFSTLEDGIPVQAEWLGWTRSPRRGPG